MREIEIQKGYTSLWGRLFREFSSKIVALLSPSQKVFYYQHEIV